MSAFIFVHSKVSGPRWTKEELDEYLPRPSEKLKIYSKGQSSLYHLAFNTALFREVLQGEGFTVAVEGYIEGDNLKRLPDFLLSEAEFDVSSYPDAFCSLAFSENCFGFYSSVTGIDQLFYYEDELGFYVTNRHNLLGLACKSLSLREDSFSWICSRGHIGDHGSYWNEIKRSRPGVKYFFDGSLRSEAGKKEGLFVEISDSDAVDYLRSVANDFSSIFSSVDAEKSLSLTGGKDSRAILGLLDYSNSLEKLRVNTTGALYSPDVMSAQCLTEKLGVFNHNITRPKLVVTAGDYAERIANDLLFDFAGKTIADMSKFSFTQRLILGGHEAGIKSPKNKAGIKEFISSRKRWCDDQTILSSEKREHITDSYLKNLKNSLSGVPVSCYDKIEGVDHRVSNRNSPNITGSHLGSSQLHPFYDGRIIKAVCGLSENMLKSQFIPYFFTNLSSKDLVNEPFANDGWPESLVSIVNERGRGSTKIQRVAPFKFLNEYPSEKSFGLFSWRLDLCDISQKKLLEYLASNREFFRFLDFDKALGIVKKPGSEKTFREMQVHLSVLKAALLHYLSDKIFCFSNKNVIVDRVRDFLQGDFDGKDVGDNSKESLEEKLLEYEEAIGSLARKIRYIEAGDIGSDERGGCRDDLHLKLGKNPVKLKKVKANKRYCVIGTLLNPLSKKQLLVYFKSLPGLSHVGFNYSKALGGYFKYFSVDGRAAKVDFRLVGDEGKLVDIYVSSWNVKDDELPVEMRVSIES